tara:strand:+ start:4925 stop:5134 length:210 start_codon:yes stop_codon:yes gene_type:complete
MKYKNRRLVKWVGFNTLFRGSFSSYNVKVCDSLINMGKKNIKDILVEYNSINVKITRPSQELFIMRGIP